MVHQECHLVCFLISQKSHVASSSRGIIHSYERDIKGFHFGMLNLYFVVLYMITSLMCPSDKIQGMNLTSLAESFYSLNGLNFPSNALVKFHSCLFNYYFIHATVTAVRNSLIGPVVSIDPLIKTFQKQSATCSHYMWTLHETQKTWMFNMTATHMNSCLLAWCLFHGNYPIFLSQ